MKNRTFGDTQQQPLSKEPLTQDEALAVKRRQHPPRETLTAVTLTEPLLQDLNHTSKFFIDYCEHSSCLA